MVEQRSHGDLELPRGGATTATKQPSSLRRRIAVPAMLDLRPPPSPGGVPAADFELLHHWKTTAGYTSIRDVIASSPTADVAASGFPSPSAAAVSTIKNHLVKHAAYAYLQPTPTATGPSRPHILRGRFHSAIGLVSVESCLGCLGRLLYAVCGGGGGGGGGGRRSKN